MPRQNYYLISQAGIEAIARMMANEELPRETIFQGHIHKILDHCLLLGNRNDSFNGRITVEEKNEQGCFVSFKDIP